MNFFPFHTVSAGDADILSRFQQSVDGDIELTAGAWAGSDDLNFAEAVLRAELPWRMAEGTGAEVGAGGSAPRLPDGVQELAKDPVLVSRAPDRSDLIWASAENPFAVPLPSLEARADPVRGLRDMEHEAEVKNAAADDGMHVRLGKSPARNSGPDSVVPPREAAKDVEGTRIPQPLEKVSDTGRVAVVEIDMAKHTPPESPRQMRPGENTSAAAATQKEMPLQSDADQLSSDRRSARLVLESPSDAPQRRIGVLNSADTGPTTAPLKKAVSPEGSPENRQRPEISGDTPERPRANTSSKGTRAVLMEQMPLPERPAGKGASSGDEARPKQLSAVESGDQGRPRLKDSLADGSATIIKARGEFETEVRRAVASGGNTQSRPDVSATNPGATPAQVFHDKPVISPEASNPEGTRSRRDDARSERYVRENRQPLQADPEKAGQVQSADAAKMGLHLRHSGETRGPHAIDTSARPDPHRSDMISGDSSSIDASPAMAREIQVARSGAPTPTIGPTARAIAVVAEEIASNAPGEIEVSMSPEELGKVRIRMTVGEAGMFVNLAAERQETAELIRRHLSLLSDELARHGFDDVEFSFGERAGDDGQRHELPTNAPEHPTQTVTSAIPATHNSGRALDLRI